MADTTDPSAGILSLLDERAKCEARIKEINLILLEIRGKIDERTLGTPNRKQRADAGVPRKAKAEENQAEENVS